MCDISKAISVRQSHLWDQQGHLSATVTPLGSCGLVALPFAQPDSHRADTVQSQDFFCYRVRHVIAAQGSQDPTLLVTCLLTTLHLGCGHDFVTPACRRLWMWTYCCSQVTPWSSVVGPFMLKAHPNMVTALSGPA